MARPGTPVRVGRGLTRTVEGGPRADALLTIHALVPFGEARVPLKIRVRRSAVPHEPSRASSYSTDWVALMVWQLIYAAFQPPSRKAEGVIHVPGSIPSTVSIPRGKLRAIADAYRADSGSEGIGLPTLFPEYVREVGSGEFVNFLKEHRPRTFGVLWTLSVGIAAVKIACIFPQPRGRQREKAKLTQWLPMALLMAHQVVTDAQTDRPLAARLGRLRHSAREALEEGTSPPDPVLLGFLSRYPDGLRHPLACALWLVDRAFDYAWAKYGVRRPVAQ